MNVEHKYLRVKALTTILFVSSFSWVGGPPIASNLSVDILQLCFRVIPICGLLVYFLLQDARSGFVQTIYLFKLPIFPLFLYVVVSFLGGLTSVNPALSAWKSIEMLVVCYWGAYVAHCMSQGMNVMALFVYLNRLIILLVLWLLIAGAAVPELGYRYENSIRLAGYYPVVNPNAIGFFALLAFSYLLWSKPGGKQLLLASAMFILFIIENSRSSYIAFVFLMSLYFVEILLKRYTFDGLMKRFIVSLGVIVVAVFAFDLIFGFFSRGLTYEGLMKMSGRMVLWDVAVREILSNIWIGNGIGTGSRYLYLEYSAIGRSMSVHNSFLEILLSGGVIGGAGLIALYIFNGIKITFQYIKDKRAGVFDSLVFSVYVVLFFRIVTGSSLASLQVEVLIFLLCVFASRDVNINKTIPSNIPWLRIRRVPG